MCKWVGGYMSRLVGVPMGRWDGRQVGGWVGP